MGESSHAWRHCGLPNTGFTAGFTRISPLDQVRPLRRHLDRRSRRPSSCRRRTPGHVLLQRGDDERRRCAGSWRWCPPSACSRSRRGRARSTGPLRRSARAWPTGSHETVLAPSPCTSRRGGRSRSADAARCVGDPMRRMVTERPSRVRVSTAPGCIGGQDTGRGSSEAAPCGRASGVRSTRVATTSLAWSSGGSRSPTSAASVAGEIVLAVHRGRGPRELPLRRRARSFGRIVVADEAVPLPRPTAGLEIRADGLWASLLCETAFEHWSLGLEAFGLRLDDDAVGDDPPAWADLVGERLPVGFDLEWELARRRSRSPTASATGRRGPCSATCSWCGTGSRSRRRAHAEHALGLACRAHGRTAVRNHRRRP